PRPERQRERRSGADLAGREQRGRQGAAVLGRQRPVRQRQRPGWLRPGRSLRLRQRLAEVLIDTQHASALAAGFGPPLFFVPRPDGAKEAQARPTRQKCRYLAATSRPTWPTRTACPGGRLGGIPGRGLA